MTRKYKHAACNTCRQRKVKCDEAFPICQRCSKAQRFCDRPTRRASTSNVPTRKHIDPEKRLPLDDAPRQALESSQLATYFRCYISDIASWYDLSDSRCSFSSEVPVLAMDEPLLFYAVIALSAIYVSRTTAPSARPIAEAYHTRCIRLLIGLDPEDVLVKKGVAIATTCLLRSYEILAESHDPNRHLKGAFSLASQLQHVLDDPSRGLLHSSFWNYLREDITFSLFGKCRLKIDLDTIPGLRNILADQDQLNAISLVLGCIINVVFGSTAEKEVDEWETLLSRVEDWIAKLPNYFDPFSRARLPALYQLPTVHMLKPCHAASRQYCLVSLAILAADAKTDIQIVGLIGLVSRMGSLASTVTTKEGLLEYIGLEVCGIAFTSNEPTVLVNAFGPISHCARYIRTEASQHEVIRNLMATKKATGWPVEHIASDLQRYWGTNTSVS